MFIIFSQIDVIMLLVIILNTDSRSLHGSGCVDRAPTVHPIESQYVMLDASSNETRNITQQNASNLSLADEPSLQVSDYVHPLQIYNFYLAI